MSAMTAILLHDLQLIRRENFLDLVSGVDGPGAGGVELGIGLPVTESFARLAGFFESQSQIVVGVGVGWRQGNGSLVSTDSVGKAAGLIQHVAQIKVSQRVAGIYFYGFAIVALRQQVVLAVVVERA